MDLNRNGWLLSSPADATNSAADTPLYQFLSRLMRGEDLSFDDSVGLFNALTDSNANLIQIAGALVALTAKGETFTELAGMASVLRERSVRIAGKSSELVDISGTGMSAAKTFNVSTAAAIVASGAGVSVAKLTERAKLSQTGSADVLSVLGVNLSAKPRAVQNGITGVGLGFMFAPNFFPDMLRVGDARRSLGIRSFLNFLVLLANPALASHQLLGVWHPSLLDVLSKSLALLISGRSWVVHGDDGLDEISISAETSVAEVTGNKIRNFKIKPEDFGLKRSETSHLKANDPLESAKILSEVLASRRRDEARSLVVINAAAAILVAGLTKDAQHAARMAEQSIDSGQAQNKLDRVKQTSNR